MPKSGVKPAARPRPAESAEAASGILPSQAIMRMIDGGQIVLAEPVADSQVQPASLDLRLGASCLSRAGELSAEARGPRANQAR